MRDKPRYSVSTKTAVIIFVTITAIMSSLGGIYYHIQKSQRMADLNEWSNTVVERISNTLVLSAWNLIYKESVLGDIPEKAAIGIVQDEMVDRRIKAVVVYGDFGRLYMGWIRNGEGLAKYDPVRHGQELKTSLMVKARHISSEDISIGKVEVYVDELPLRAELRQLFYQIILEILAVSLVVSGVLFVALRAMVVNSLLRLARSVEQLERGQAGDSISINSNDELGLLAESFNRMQKTVVSQIAELRKERDFSAGIVAKAPVIVCGILPDGTTSFINAAGERVVGYKAEEIIGKNWWQTFYPGEEYSQVDRLMEIFASGKEVSKYVMTLTAADGKKKIVAWDSMNRYSTDGKLVEVIGFGDDMTDRLAAEKEKQSLESMLRHSQKMEAIGQFAGGVAHDLNNILQGILGYAELICDSDNINEIRGGVEEIRKVSLKAAALTKQLLLFSRRESTQKSNVDLNDLIDNMMKMLRRIIGEKIKIDVHFHPEINSVYADCGQIEQIIVNICINARDAMPDGGTLTIETENVCFDGDFHDAHPWAREGHFVCLAISDTGMGMTQEVQEKIFEPFFTTKEVGKGTGLGLATVYGIVESHSGIIRVYSEPGRGTTFRIYLPVSSSQIRLESKVAPPEASLTGNETLLLAEDDEMVRNIAMSFLRRAGYKIIVARDGLEAMQAYSQNAGEIKLAILDVVMPVYDGKEVLQSIRARDERLPVILSSGYSFQQLGTNFKLDAYTRTAQKPYSPKELLEMVRSMLDA